jgi:hypothetical protein
MKLKLSIFPDCEPHPKDRDRKKEEAMKTSKPHTPVVVEITNSEEVLDYITQYAWSPAVFTEFRRKADFISTDFMVLDIDNEITIEEAEKRCYDLDVFAIIAATPNFSKEHHKFRVVFPLVRPIKETAEFEATWNKLAETFPELDNQCSDSCRFYFGSTLQDGCFVHGNKLLEPVRVSKKESDYVASRKKLVEPNPGISQYLKALYDRVPKNIPECIDHFLSEGHTGLDGGWIVTLNSFSFVLGLQCVDFDAIIEVVEDIAPYPLDERDMKTIERGYNDGLKSRKGVSYEDRD